jgi:uncharacterized membrane protein YhaH (DUF805 family)
MSTPYSPYDRAQQQPSTPGAYSAGPYPPQGGYSPYPPPGYGQQGGYASAGPRGYLQGGPVGFGEAITGAFGNMFNYQNRASRSAYWWFVLFQALAWIGVLVFAGIFAAVKIPVLSILVCLAAFIGLFLAGLSLAVRRLHDQDKSGFWYFIVLVPFIGGIWMLILVLMEGTRGPNRFG